MATRLWNSCQDLQEAAPHVQAFLRDLARLCRQYEIQIDHEDRNGAFELYSLTPADTSWWLPTLDTQ